jgi:hypothetical protein
MSLFYHDDDREEPESRHDGFQAATVYWLHHLRALIDDSNLPGSYDRSDGSRCIPGDGDWDVQQFMGEN